MCSKKPTEPTEPEPTEPTEPTEQDHIADMPTEPTEEEDCVDPYADMPSLACGTCKGAVSSGGSEWQKQHPNEPKCTCEETHSIVINHMCNAKFID